MNDVQGKPPLGERLRRAIMAEAGQVRPKLYTLSLLARALPAQTANDLRTDLIRKAGFSIGPRTIFYGAPRFTGASEDLAPFLSIGADCVIDVGCEIELGEKITIGDRVTLGHEVMLLTTSHELGPREHRAGPVVRAPVVLEDGCWLGPRCTVLPGVTIGKGAIVAPGSVVTKDVTANTRVSGNPARQIEVLST